MVVMNNATVIELCLQEIQKNEAADLRKVGNHPAFVVPAYALIFGIWGVASVYDYITSKWRTVGSRRRRGKLHICVLLVPMAYMLAYIKFQADAEDYKEMSGGLIALCFALVDFARTVMGLWQLHVFRHWIVASIRSLESLGYVAHENDRDSDRAGDGEEEEGSKEEKKARRSGGPRNLFPIADNVVVNDLLLDNRLTEGEVEYLLRVRSGEARNIWKATMYDWEPRFTSPLSYFHLEPFEPEDVYMRWACVLVSQVFPKWLEDMKQSGISDMSSDDGLTEELSRFRRGVLCSAALHTNSGGGIQSPDGLEMTGSGVPYHSLLDFKIWRNYPKLCAGAFSLQEFLRVACKTGRGLPFAVPHEKAKRTGKTSEYSYSKFRPKLHRIREMFPVDDVEKLESFETFHLEWLAVFLSVPDWKPKSTSTTIIGQDDKDPKEAPYNSTTIAVDNLRCQLGLSSSSSQSGFFFSKSLSSFPLFKGVLKRSFWGNRNVLEISLHIDNMFALSVGSQYAFMIRKKNETKKRISEALKGLGHSALNDIYSSDCVHTGNGSKVKTCAAEERGIDEENSGEEADISSDDLSQEAELFMYQLLNDESEVTVLQQRLTFLGCSMESLRCSLAMWVQDYPNYAESVWTPSLEAEGTRQETFLFRASESFVKVMKGNDWGKVMGERYAQMRLLWELQSHFLSRLPGVGRSPARPESIILCLLSFPAIECNILKPSTAVELCSENTDDGVSIDMLLKKESVRVSFSVPLGPQPIHVAVHLRGTADCSVEITASLCGESTFVWERWRNNFSSRLAGVRRWKLDNGFNSTPIVTTEESINTGLRSAKLFGFGTGQDMCIWLGWPPHRPSLSVFEIISSAKLILQIEKEALYVRYHHFASAKQSTGLYTSKQAPVIFAIAGALELEYCSPVVHNILSTIAGHGAANQHQLHFHGERMLVDVKDLGTLGERQIAFQLKLGEAIAVQHRKFEYLDKILRALHNRQRTSNFCDRAMRMVENVCSLSAAPKEEFHLGSPGLRLNDERMAKIVLCFMKDMAGTTQGHAVGQSFARLCTSFENFDNAKNMKLAVKYLLGSILSSTFKLAEGELQAVKRDLGRIVGRLSAETSPVALLLFQLFSKKRTDFAIAHDALFGSPSSPTLAAKQYSIGVYEEQCSACAKFLAGMYHHGFQNNTPQPSRAVQLYTPAVEAGNADAMINLGYLLQHGADDVLADPAKAKELYERAVAAGHVLAISKLGLLLVNGAEGVQAEPARAKELFTRAAVKGEASALTNLGNLLKTGADGVEADPVQAKWLFTRAITKGFAPAMYSLGRMLHHGVEGVQANPAKAKRLYTRAGAKGHVQAMNNLGYLLEHGAAGVQADPVEAKKLYERAIDGGVENSLVHLARLLVRGAEGVDADPERAVSLYTRFIQVGRKSKHFVAAVAELADLQNSLQDGDAQT